VTASLRLTEECFESFFAGGGKGFGFWRGAAPVGAHCDELLENVGDEASFLLLDRYRLGEGGRSTDEARSIAEGALNVQGYLAHKKQPPP